MLPVSKKLLTKFFRRGGQTTLGLLGASHFFLLSNFLRVAMFCVLNVTIVATFYVLNIRTVATFNLPQVNVPKKLHLSNLPRTSSQVFSGGGWVLKAMLVFIFGLLLGRS